MPSARAWLSAGHTPILNNPKPNGAMRRDVAAARETHSRERQVRCVAHRDPWRAMEHPSLDVLREQALPEVAAALRASSQRILQNWRQVTIETLPQADELTRRQFEDSVPALLRELADALAASRPAPTEKFIADAPEHGTVRFHQQFNLNELLIEYHLLRRVIVDEVSAELKRPLNTVESIGLHSGIDVALRQAAVAFAKQQADELTNEANAMAKYLSFLSHDLRGGLNGAILMIEVLKRDLAKETRFAESINDLDMMRRSMLETVATMDRFLHAERLRRGKLPVKLSDVDLAGLFNRIAHGAQYQLQDQHAIVQCDVRVPKSVRTDGEVVTIILQNLLSNAIKYSPERSEIRIIAEQRPESGVRISVVDQGPGIPPEKMQHLFAPFERGETYGQKGTGLGLTIARQAAELLGAKLSAESTPGQGAKFHLDLPMQK
jgi:signal transduction histidine kinase